jgi:regulator of replication initiation timing
MKDKTGELEATIRAIEALADRAVDLRREKDHLQAQLRMLEVENARLRARLSHYETLSHYDTNEIERRMADGTG